MDTEGYQKELFDFGDKPRKNFPRFGRILPKADFEGKISINLSLEKIIFISIGIILLLVIIFALGVERGRSLSAASLEEMKSQIPAKENQLASTQVITPPAQPQAAAPNEAPAQAVKELKPAPVQSPARTEEALSDNAESPAKPYAIIAAAYKGKDTAAAVVRWLKKEGYKAYLKKDGQYYLACVGSYDKQAGARADLAKVKRLYKDAYIIKRQ